MYVNLHLLIIIFYISKIIFSLAYSKNRNFQNSVRNIRFGKPYQ
jgi:hypothetical protein